MSSHQSVFPAADWAAWQTLVEKILKGAPSESLVQRDEDGLEVQALHALGHDDGTIVPAGPLAQQRLAAGWDVAQPILAAHNGDRDAMIATNHMILDAVESGATSLILYIDDASANHFDLLFDQIILPAIGVQICAGADTDSVIDKFTNFSKGHDAGALNVNAGYNPLSDGDAAITAGLARQSNGLPVVGLFHFDGWDWHNRGLSAAGEIGVVLAGLAALLRRSHDPEAIIEACNISLALSADSFLSLAKMRAMRLGWAGLCAAFGIARTPLFITGITSLRMMSALDQDVNMLRNATALLGGAIGGADRMAGFAHNALGDETEAGRRLTRTTQLMMIEESGLAHSRDPAAGAPFLEQRSDDLAKAGWTVMQQIETAGGLDDALQSGLIASMADTASARRHAALSSGRDQLVGVTLQPAQDGPATSGKRSEIFAGLCRPAAFVEALRQRKSTSRILILMAVDADPQEERAIRKWLAIGGLAAVTLIDYTANDIATAAPNIIILGDGVDQNAVPDGLRTLTASRILNSDDQLGMLADMIGASDDTFS